MGYNDEDYGERIFKGTAKITPRLLNGRQIAPVTLLPYVDFCLNSSISRDLIYRTALEAQKRLTQAMGVSFVGEDPNNVIDFKDFVDQLKTFYLTRLYPEYYKPDYYKDELAVVNSFNSDLLAAMQTALWAISSDAQTRARATQKVKLVSYHNFLKANNFNADQNKISIDTPNAQGKTVEQLAMQEGDPLVLEALGLDSCYYSAKHLALRRLGFR